MLVITEVKITGTPQGKFLGYARVVLGGSIVLKNMKIIRHRLAGEPPRVMMPSVKLADGSDEEIYHPIHREFRTFLEAAVLAEAVRCGRVGHGIPAEKQEAAEA